VSAYAVCTLGVKSTLPERPRPVCLSADHALGDKVGELALDALELFARYLAEPAR
jgi:hypothetical protein